MWIRHPKIGSERQVVATSQRRTTVVYKLEPGDVKGGCGLSENLFNAASRTSMLSTSPAERRAATQGTVIGDGCTSRRVVCSTQAGSPPPPSCSGRKKMAKAGAKPRTIRRRLSAASPGTSVISGWSSKEQITLTLPGPA